MKPVEVSLEQVLLARENRAGRQQRLLAQYGLPLVSFTMNIACLLYTSDAADEVVV